ncbi:uncharacterized protein J3R85_004658 [Psidium guajava]|nr:uncharacterized protein J3R85_004658 [Psidium guajava]
MDAAAQGGEGELKGQWSDGRGGACGPAHSQENFPAADQEAHPVWAPLPTRDSLNQSPGHRNSRTGHAPISRHFARSSSFPRVPGRVGPRTGSATWKRDTPFDPSPAQVEP